MPRKLTEKEKYERKDEGEQGIGLHDIIFLNWKESIRVYSLGGRFLYWSIFILAWVRLFIDDLGYSEHPALDFPIFQYSLLNKILDNLAFKNLTEAGELFYLLIAFISATTLYILSKQSEIVLAALSLEKKLNDLTKKD